MRNRDGQDKPVCVQDGWTKGKIQLGTEGSPWGWFVLGLPPQPLVLSSPPGYCCGAACRGHADSLADELVPLGPTWHGREHPVQQGGTVPRPDGTFLCGTPTGQGPIASEGILTQQLLHVSWWATHKEGKSRVLLPLSPFAELICLGPGCVWVLQETRE